MLIRLLCSGNWLKKNGKGLPQNVFDTSEHLEARCSQTARLLAIMYNVLGNSVKPTPFIKISTSGFRQMSLLASWPRLQKPLLDFQNRQTTSQFKAAGDVIISYHIISHRQQPTNYFFNNWCFERSRVFYWTVAEFLIHGYGGFLISDQQHAWFIFCFIKKMFNNIISEWFNQSFLCSVNK